MAGAFKVLIRLRARQFLRAGLKSGRPAFDAWRQGGQALGLVVLLYVAWQIYRVATLWMSSHNSVTRPVVFLLLRPALVALGSAVVLTIFVYAFSNLIGGFLDRGDLQLLLVAPVPKALVFGERILLTSLSYSGLLLIVVPALYAVGNSTDLSAWFYPAVLLGILVLPVAPTSLAALVLLALLRWLPPVRARTVSLLASLVALGIFFTVTRGISKPGSVPVPSLPAWLPTTWPSRATAAVALGDWQSAAGYSLLSIALAVALFATATTLSTRVLGSGIQAYREVHRSSHPRQPGAQPAPHVSSAANTSTVLRTGPAWWAVFIKDWRTLLRDSQRLIVFAYPLLIIGFNAYQLLTRHRSTHETALATTLILLIMAALLLVNSTTPGVLNWEGRGLILLALAPVSEEAIVLSKWLVALLPPLVMVEVALAAVELYARFPAGDVALLSVALALLVVALVGATLTITIAWPKLDATNARRAASATAVMVGLAVNVLISVGTGVLLFISMFVWHGTAATAAAAGVLTALVAIILADSVLGPSALRRLMRSGDLVHGLA